MSFRQMLCFCGVAVALAAFGPAPVRADPNDRAAQLQDLELVRTQYLPKEMAFTPATRAMAEVLLDKLETRAGSMSATEFAVQLAEIGALADNAHSGLRLFDPSVAPTKRLPVRLVWTPDALIVMRSSGPAKDLAGARVLRIEGRSPEALFAGAKVLQGGKRVSREFWLDDWIESEGVLQALGLAKSADEIAMTLKLPDGRVVERTIPMLPVAEFGDFADLMRIWSPEPAQKETGWSSALALDREPLYLRDADRPFRVLPLAKQNALYIQFRSNSDEDGYPMAKFLEEVRRSIQTAHPRDLVVDLRFDNGGNLLTTLDFMRGLTKTVPGRVYLLTGPYTFSAGIISAAALKQGGGRRVTIVGDEVGDRPHFWSEGLLVKLPNSHLWLRYTDGQFNLKDGCTGEPACMDDRYPINVNFASLATDIRAPLTAEAYLAGRDPAMEAVTADIARRGGR